LLISNIAVESPGMINCSFKFNSRNSCVWKSFCRYFWSSDL